MKEDFPVTQAVRVLRASKVDFTPYLYAYVDHGGSERAAEALGLDEHQVIKTLVMEVDRKTPILVLMHGDREVSTKQLARQIGAKEVSPCDPKQAEKLTGYQVGGISPFGTRTRLKVYAESTILELDRIFINCGKRGFLAEMEPRDLERVLQPERVSVSIQP